MDNITHYKINESTLQNNIEIVKSYWKQISRRHYDVCVLYLASS